MDNSNFREAIFHQPETNSVMKIGKEQAINIMTDAKFNKLQKFMWKKLFNVIVEDYNNG